MSAVDPVSPMTRRRALKVGAATVAASAVAASLPALFIRQTVQAQEEPPPHDPGTALPESHPAALIAPEAVTPPPLGVIALTRLCFGPRPGVLDFGTFAAQPGATDAERLASFVDWQLNLTDEGADCTNRLNAAGLSTLNQSLTQLWAASNNPNYQWGRPVREVRAATFIRAIYSQRQLYELLVDFWHNHFNIYAWDGYANATWPHWDREVIRRHALGNFRQMLEAVATHPAMLFYLDNYINQVAGFNENWARELCELHTLGSENYLGVRNPMTVNTIPFPGGGNFPADTPVAEGYVDNDVYEIARCFTGWRVKDGWWPVQEDTGEFLYYDSWHDKANKFVLGRYFPNTQANEAMRDGRDALDLLAYHPGTARFLCRKLIRRFITDHPPQSLVDSAAAVFIAQRFAPDQIKQVLRHILLSPEFQSTWAQKIKRPFEAAVSALRACNADVNPTKDGFFWHYDDGGQELFSWRPPNGYPDLKSAWLSSTYLLARWQFVISAIEGWIDHWENNTSIDLVRINIVGQTPGAYGATATQLVDYWINRILGRPMSNPANRTRIIDFLRGPYSPNTGLSQSHVNDYLPRAVALILMSPDFQWR